MVARKLWDSGKKEIRGLRDGRKMRWHTEVEDAFRKEAYGDAVPERLSWSLAFARRRSEEMAETTNTESIKKTVEPVPINRVAETDKTYLGMKLEQWKRFRNNILLPGMLILGASVPPLIDGNALPFSRVLRDYGIDMKEVGAVGMLVTLSIIIKGTLYLAEYRRIHELEADLKHIEDELRKSKRLN